MIYGVSQNSGYHLRGPYNKDYSILGSILGSPYLGKVPYSSFHSSIILSPFVEARCRQGYFGVGPGMATRGSSVLEKAQPMNQGPWPSQLKNPTMAQAKLLNPNPKACYRCSGRFLLSNEGQVVRMAVHLCRPSRGYPGPE